jgi:uncharacterized protein (TIGR02246 family)
MRTRTLLVIALLGVGALLGWLAASARLTNWVQAQDKPVANDQKEKSNDKDKVESKELAALRKTADEFAKAFAKGDAKAVAEFWTADGEFVGADGEPVRGRKEIESAYAEFFKKHPKATVEVTIESAKLLGPHTALEEGILKVNLPGEKDPHISRYSVLHVRDNDAWKMASVREWVPDPAQLVTLKDVEWLIGDWSAKSGDHEATVTYSWDEDKVTLRGRYVVKRGDKLISSGTQLIRKDPNGGLRSWQFDNNGSNGEWAWTREGSKWLIDAEGVLPDGSETTAMNLLIPLGKDSFTWQSLERTAAGSDLPNTPPVKVTRVKKK